MRPFLRTFYVERQSNSTMGLVKTSALAFPLFVIPIYEYLACQRLENFRPQEKSGSQGLVIGSFRSILISLIMPFHLLWIKKWIPIPNYLSVITYLQAAPKIQLPVAALDNFTFLSYNLGPALILHNKL